MLKIHFQSENKESERILKKKNPEGIQND